MHVFAPDSQSLVDIPGCDCLGKAFLACTGIRYSRPPQSWEKLGWSLPNICLEKKNAVSLRK